MLVYVRKTPEDDDGNIYHNEENTRMAETLEVTPRPNQGAR